MKIYKLYGHSKTKGYILIHFYNDIKRAYEDIATINPKEYYSYILKETDTELNQDKMVESKVFGIKCEIEFVDDLETDFEVKATTFNPLSRAKKKEELRKMIQHYQDYGEDDYLNM